MININTIRAQQSERLLDRVAKTKKGQVAYSNTPAQRAKCASVHYRQRAIAVTINVQLPLYTPWRNKGSSTHS